MDKHELAKLLVEKAQSLIADGGEGADAKAAPKQDTPLTRDDVASIVREVMAEGKADAKAPADPKEADKAKVEAAIKELLPQVGVPQKGNGLDREAVAKMTPEQINSSWEAVSAAISE